MSAKHTVKHTQGTGSAGKTDWARVEKLSNRNREKAIASDPDAAPLLDRQWFETAKLVMPKRKVRIDESRS